MKDHASAPELASVTSVGDFGIPGPRLSTENEKPDIALQGYEVPPPQETSNRNVRVGIAGLALSAFCFFMAYGPSKEVG